MRMTLPAPGSAFRRRPRRALGMASALLLAGCAAGSGLHGDGPMVTPRVAEAALAAGNPQLALHVATFVLENHPRDLQALIAKGDALYALHDMPGAAEAYRAALAVDPASSGAGLGLGRAVIRSHPDIAEAAFLGVTAHDPGNLAAWNDIGIARDLQGRHDDAQLAYRRALAAAPEADDVAGNLGLSLALSGRRAEAVTVLRPLLADLDAQRLWRGNLEMAQVAPPALPLAGTAPRRVAAAVMPVAPAAPPAPAVVAALPAPAVVAAPRRPVAALPVAPPQVATAAAAPPPAAITAARTPDRAAPPPAADAVVASLPPALSAEGLVAPAEAAAAPPPAAPVAAAPPAPTEAAPAAPERHGGACPD